MKPMPVAGAGMGGDKNANVMGWEKLKPSKTPKKVAKPSLKPKKKVVAPSYSKIQKSIQKSMGYK